METLKCKQEHRNLFFKKENVLKCDQRVMPEDTIIFKNVIEKGNRLRRLRFLGEKNKELVLRAKMILGNIRP